MTTLPTRFLENVVQVRSGGDTWNWLHIWLAANPNALLLVLMVPHNLHFIDRTRTAKAFNDFYALQQDKKSVEDLNSQITKCFLFMAPQLAEAELLRVYTNMLLRIDSAVERQLKVKSPATLEARATLMEE
jgi:hypothetical protein